MPIAASAQACRLPYELVCDGRDVDLAEQQYLLSPQDLAAYDLIPDLVGAGVTAFKIEGRLKTPEYVANITRQYRRALDAAAAGRAAQFTARDVEEMELSFSRGFSHGWLDGCDHKKLVPATSSAKRGVLLGRVRFATRDRVAIELRSSIRRGDGIVFEGNRAKGNEQGGRVFEVFQDGRSLTEPVASGVVELALAHGAIDFAALRPGQNVWKTDDPQLTSRLRKTFTGARPERRLAIDLVVEGAVGRPLVVRAATEQGVACRVESAEPLAPARKHPLSAEVVAEQFGRLGGTAYVLGRCEARIEGQPMAPLSVLGALRHELVRRLDEALRSPASQRVSEPGVVEVLRREIRAGCQGADQEHQAARSPALHVLCRSLDQLRWVLEAGATSVMADLADIRQYAEAVEMTHGGAAQIAIATPRIQKPGEMGIFRALARHAADAVLVRNFAALRFFADEGQATIADFSLNATNELSVAHLLDAGARRVTASYDLNREQLLDLVAAVPPGWLEVVIHQHMPMFHMEHCVFLRGRFARHEQAQLRPPLRRPRSSPPRPHGHGAQADGRRRLPQHAVQRHAAKRGRGRAATGRARHRRLSHRTVGRPGCG